MDELNNILFDACRDGKVEVIKFIVQNNANLIMKKDTQNNTALHVACESGLLLDGIECLCSAYPNALTIFNDEGASPFHMICFHGKSLDNLKFLNNKLPIGLVTTNENGDLPIHWISDTASEELVKYLIEQFPKSAEVKNKEDALPIHIACNKGLSLDVIRLLHNAHPAGVLQPDKEGMLPIHDACEGAPNLELVKLLYEVAPASFKKADNEGNFALHYAVCSSHEVIKFVIEANKLALQKPNSSGYLPIHKACSLAVEVNIVKLLHENYPEGIKVKTSKGSFPFHLATTNLPALAYLHKFFDEAIEIPDKRDRYPIHIACEKGAPLDVITFLVEKCPAAAQKADRSQMLPLHHAIINKLPSPAIKFLVDFYPDALRCPDANRHLPFHLLFLHSNEIEVFQFLRTKYRKEFEELMTCPMKIEGNAASSSSQNDQEQSLPAAQNQARIKQDDAASHPDLENHQHTLVEESPLNNQHQSSPVDHDQTTTKQDDAAFRSDLENHQQNHVAETRAVAPSVKVEDPIVEGNQDDSLGKKSPSKVGRRKSKEVVVLDSSSDGSSCSSIESVNEAQLIKNEVIEQNNKGKRLRSENDSTIIEATKSTNSQHSTSSSSVPGHKRSNKTKIHWSEDKIDACLSASRSTNGPIEKKNLFEYVPKKVKTKSRKQCYESSRITKQAKARSKHDDACDILKKLDKEKVANDPSQNSINDNSASIKDRNDDLPGTPLEETATNESAALSLADDGASSEEPATSNTDSSMASSLRFPLSLSSELSTGNNDNVIKIAATNSNDSSRSSDDDDHHFLV